MRTVGEVIEAVAASNLKPGRHDLLSFNDPLGSNDLHAPRTLLQHRTNKFTVN